MGKTDLGKWMITNGGEYSADATYEQLTMVKYGNSTYITLKTVTGITPVDDKINYQLMAQGFDATALSAVQAEDTQGLCGEKGNIVTAQSLVDALADKVINTVMAKIGTAALTGGMTDLSSGLNKLNSDLQYLKKAESNTQLIESSVDSYTDIQSLNISPGVYIVIGRIEFQSTSATGDRKGRLAFSTSSSTLELATECVRAASNNWVRLNVCDILQVDTPGSIKVQGSQNSGSAINTFGWVTYMRLKAL